MARNRLVWLVCLSILSVLPASATFVPYSNLTLWEQVTTLSGTVIDFNQEGPSPGYNGPEMSYFDIGGIRFTSPYSFVQLCNAGDACNWNTGAIIRSTHADAGALLVTLTTPATSFSTLMAINNGGTNRDMDIKVYRSGVTLPVWQQTLPTSASPVPTFFGIVSTIPAETFDSILFTPAPGRALLDNLRLGTYHEPVVEPPVGDVPELGTGVLSLCGGILLAAGGLRKRLKAS